MNKISFSSRGTRLKETKSRSRLESQIRHLVNVWCVISGDTWGGTMGGTRGRTMVGMGVGTMDVDKGGIISGTGVGTGAGTGCDTWVLLWVVLEVIVG